MYCSHVYSRRPQVSREMQEQDRPPTHAPTTRDLSFLGNRVIFDVAWQTGIGGEFWTTGIDLAKQLEEHEPFFRTLFKGRRVIELGSGTGLVGLCAGFLGAAEMILTDNAAHIPILKANLEQNEALYNDADDGIDVDDGEALPVERRKRRRVVEYDWSAPADHLGSTPFDVILGTDLAYTPELYDPLIKAYSRLSGPETVIILGVTRSDTGPAFFSKLNEAGFDYCLYGGGKAMEQSGGNFVLLSIVRRKP